jgi:hypothetical protein
MRYVYIVLVALTAATGAQAIEVGDTFFTGNGPGQTVVAIRRPSRDTFEVTARVMTTNADEFCMRSQALTVMKPGWEKCIQETVSAPRKITVNCRPATILTDEGAYRRGAKDGPWVSVAQPNFIIQGERLFRMTCGKR